VLGVVPWKKETLQRAIEAAIAIKIVKNRSNILKELALIIANTGDIKWATSTAKRIPDAKIKDNTLTEIQYRIEKK
jgi:hypothetical protein